MLDFFQVGQKEPRGKNGVIEIYPDFTVGRSKDLMVRGQSFYAIWDEEKGLWSTDEYDVQRLVDQQVREHAEKLKSDGVECTAKFLRSYNTNGWNQFRKFLKNVPDNGHPLDMKLTFANTKVKKSDYVSRRLPYSLAAGDYSAWDELVGTLYDPVEREKIEWAIGAIVSGDSKRIEKFLVFYGPGGTGKSTILKIIQKLFAGYIAMFEAKALVGNNNSFATEAFKSNPLVAIQHDGDLSKIEDNSTLNSIVGHDTMRINEKYKAGYEMVLSAMLFMGTNKPVKITDAKSGLIRRLIDVAPSLRTIPPDHYKVLMDRIDFELGAIAQHCLDVYKSLGRTKYNGYKPERMMLLTDPFYNFVEDHRDIFELQGGVTLKAAWDLYKVWAEDTKLGYSMKQYQFREALKAYFKEFHDRVEFGGVLARSVYLEFNVQQFKAVVPETSSEPKAYSLVMEEPESILDEMYAGMPAQYANASGNPKLYWDDSVRFDKDGNEFIPGPEQICSTVLGDLETHKLHFLKLPETHIVIDFDLTDESGEKSLEENLKAASSWPPTYAELSKSGNGVHLHYIYDGDVSVLSSEYSPGIEIKVYRGNASLRRKLSRCNNVSVATISSGLPFREKKPVLVKEQQQSEQQLRYMIKQNLNKAFHSGTKPSIDFIAHLLDEAYRAGYPFDVSDMRGAVTAFAVNSKNQADKCIRIVNRMQWKSADSTEDAPREEAPAASPREERIVFFDCEVYPNLFVVCWKYHGSDTVVQMIEPTPQEIETLLFNFKLVGFNNRGYDNHILWARYLGATTEELYHRSQRIIVEKDPNAQYGKAWSASYADVYDFSVDKMSLKKWQILLGIHHMEMDIPWDQPVPKERIQDVVKYCCNDVNSLEVVFDHCHQDFVARQMLAEMSGLTVNHSTRQHAIRIMFGDDKKPQSKFVYTDLSEMFPGYKFDPYVKGDKSTYKGEPVGEGGYVYAEPGMYENVALLDIASMHPTSIEELNLFGPYTEKFSRLKAGRLALKNGDYKEFDRILPGVGIPASKEDAKALSNALKLVINSIYGYTSATFDNPFRDKRNVDNIVAKRGALFMVDLKNALQEQGVQVVHIKTDSVKIPNATPDIIAFVQEFGAKYGYTFEHEATYKKMCLVNDAVFIAYVGWNADGKPEHWKAVGAEFQNPFVFKTLFTDEPITFNDLCVTKQVQKGAMYLRFPEGDIKIDPNSGQPLTFERLVELAEDPDPETYDTHVGRSGLFVPINPDQDMFKGGMLLCLRDGKEYAVAGTKGFKWAEADMVKALEKGAIERMIWENPLEALDGTGSIADVVDLSYFHSLAESAVQSIAEYGDFEEFADKVVFDAASAA
ncbi:DNA primase/polymerase [Streptomyces phage CricKo]|nr:DNA primase/polymerase [Streptomyces phage Rainydai]QJD49942.1 DNA primase/polymerase [Streptomyces phage CricKo]QNL30674.1 DNA primase/polymerase [Streptomyces phage Thiqqums]